MKRYIGFTLLGFLVAIPVLATVSAVLPAPRPVVVGDFTFRTNWNTALGDLGTWSNYVYRYIHTVRQKQPDGVTPDGKVNVGWREEFYRMDAASALVHEAGHIEALKSPGKDFYDECLPTQRQLEFLRERYGHRSLALQQRLIEEVCP